MAPIGLVVVGSLTLWYAFNLQFGVKRMMTERAWLLAWLPVVLLVAEVFIVETSLFLYGTPVGYSATLAQGRYFLPLLTLPLLSIGLLREPRVLPRSTRWVLLGSLVMLLWLVLKVFVHDYNLSRGVTQGIFGLRVLLIDSRLPRSMFTGKRRIRRTCRRGTRTNGLRSACSRARDRLPG